MNNNEDNTMNNNNNNNGSRWGIVLLWSALCGGGWFVLSALSVSSLDHLSPDYGEQATAATVNSLCGLGCAGGIWGLGMVAMLLVFAVVRR